MPEFRLQAVGGERIPTICRLKPELQQPATGFQGTLSGTLPGNPRGAPADSKAAIRAKRLTRSVPPHWNRAASRT
jgi:hypothetical protein